MGYIFVMLNFYCGLLLHKALQIWILSCHLDTGTVKQYNKIIWSLGFLVNSCLHYTELINLIMWVVAIQPRFIYLLLHPRRVRWYKQRFFNMAMSLLYVSTKKRIENHFSSNGLLRAFVSLFSVLLESFIVCVSPKDAHFALTFSKRCVILWDHGNSCISMLFYFIFNIILKSEKPFYNFLSLTEIRQIGKVKQLTMGRWEGTGGSIIANPKMAFQLVDSFVQSIGTTRLVWKGNGCEIAW